MMKILYFLFCLMMVMTSCVLEAVEDCVFVMKKELGKILRDDVWPMEFCYYYEDENFVSYEEMVKKYPNAQKVSSVFVCDDFTLQENDEKRYRDFFKEKFPEMKNMHEKKMQYGFFDEDDQFTELISDPKTSPEIIYISFKSVKSDPKMLKESEIEYLGKTYSSYDELPKEAFDQVRKLVVGNIMGEEDFALAVKLVEAKFKYIEYTSIVSSARVICFWDIILPPHNYDIIGNTIVFEQKASLFEDSSEEPNSEAYDLYFGYGEEGKGNINDMVKAVKAPESIKNIVLS